MQCMLQCDAERLVIDQFLTRAAACSSWGNSPFRARKLHVAVGASQFCFPFTLFVYESVGFIWYLGALCW
jgi:hypothetical protein